MKTAIILGTRPEIIKLSPIIRQYEERGLDYFILHTGQHYSYNMDKVFFEQLQLPAAKHNLDVGSGPHGRQTGKMLQGIEQILQKEEPEVALVQGDTNTVLAGAIASAKLQIRIGHVEAGLRSFDRCMPEEINRTLADHCSDYLFAPTEQSKQNLIREGVKKENVFVVGNTVVDAVHQNLEIAKQKTNALRQQNVKSFTYILATAHRQENVDETLRLQGIVKGLRRIHSEFQIPVIYPVHPRTKKQIETFNINTEGINLIEPLDYLSFLQLESQAELVLTDSGGVQEETCILNVPCVTLRDNTERPETVEVGSNMLAGTDPQKILEKAKIMVSKKKEWTHPFGSGQTGKLIVDILIKENKRRC